MCEAARLVASIPTFYNEDYYLLFHYFDRTYCGRTTLSKAQQRKKRQQANLQAQSSAARTRSKSSNQRRKVQRSSNRNFLIGTGIGVLIVIIAIGAFVFYKNQSASNGNISGVVTYSNLSRNHVTGTVNYPQVPPVGGDHNPVWQNCGIYTSPVPNENAVHSMEHGAVWITYQPSLSTSDIQTLQGLVRGHSYVILSPYTGLPSPVVASAWGVQLKVNSANDPRIAQFISKYEQGPQTPEQGSPCTGGNGTPQ